MTTRRLGIAVVTLVLAVTGGAAYAPNEAAQAVQKVREAALEVVSPGDGAVSAEPTDQFSLN